MVPYQAEFSPPDNNQAAKPPPIVQKRSRWNVLAVLCNTRRPQSIAAADYGQETAQQRDEVVQLWFPELHGDNYQVDLLWAPSLRELRSEVAARRPSVLLLQAEAGPSSAATGGARADLGPLSLGDGRPLSSEHLLSVMEGHVPELVFVQASGGGRYAEPLRSTEGLSNIFLWNGTVEAAAAALFRRTFFAALGSPCEMCPWDAFQITCSGLQAASASASASASAGAAGARRSPAAAATFYGEPPKKGALAGTAGGGPRGAGGSPPSLDAGALHPLRLLLYRGAHAGALEEEHAAAVLKGVEAAMVAEVRPARLLHRISVAPPPSGAAAALAGVLFQRCDVCTATRTRIATVMAATPAAMADDAVVELSIRRELARCAERMEPAEGEGEGEEEGEGEGGSSGSLAGDAATPRRSLCVAQGAPVWEATARAPRCVIEILQQLAVEPRYRVLAALGVAALQGQPVAAFGAEDARAWDALFEQPAAHAHTGAGLPAPAPTAAPAPHPAPVPCPWDMEGPLLHGPAPERLRVWVPVEAGVPLLVEAEGERGGGAEAGWGGDAEAGLAGARSSTRIAARAGAIAGAGGIMGDAGVGVGVGAEPPPPPADVWRAALKPLPRRVRKGGGGAEAASMHVATPQAQLAATAGTNLLSPGASPAAAGAGAALPPSKALRPSPGARAPLPGAQAVPQHGCKRPPLAECSEEAFIADVVAFLVAGGEGRLLPPGGLAAFPDVQLNSVRLDLWGLYKEVVSRGGYHMGHEINWKGQVFANMSNYTATNKMTGVGNTLKKHYEVYLLAYEFAHNDDIAGEFCILCRRGTPGDWISCGQCKQWTHFDCDWRADLGAFSDYSGEDGLEYICPHCEGSGARAAKGRAGGGAGVGVGAEGGAHGSEPAKPRPGQKRPLSTLTSHSS